MTRTAAEIWDDASLCACLCALAPAQLGGVVLRGASGAVRDAWLRALLDILPCAMPFRRVPLHASDARLFGGLDLCATLAAGRPVSERGILHEAHGGFLLLAMAERLSAGAAARFMSVMDAGQVIVERDGLSTVSVSEVGVIALDESDDHETGLVEGLKDRLALTIDLRMISARQLSPLPWTRSDIAQAASLYAKVDIEESLVHALCAAAAAHGIDSLRAPLLACRTARALAALQGRTQVCESDAACAARLVLAPRARTRAEQSEADDGSSGESAKDLKQDQGQAEEQSKTTPDQATAQEDSASVDAAPGKDPTSSQPEQRDEKSQAQADAGTGPQDAVLAAIACALPEGLLGQLKPNAAGHTKASAAMSGRSGSARENPTRGRPLGSRRGELTGKARLHLLETLRAAAPWQRLRQQQHLTLPDATPAPRIQVRRQDFYIRRFVQRAQTTTIFLVDASGSSALHRLAEAKGAVEQLLAECYIRRDRVAVLGFRQTSAQLLLPPTRSLVRAKRSLAAMPASGGTPLASAIDAGAALADNLRRQGDTPFIVLLSDGRANVARDGSHDRGLARQDALSAGGALRASQLTSLFVDTSPRASIEAQGVALSMGAHYVALPHVDSSALCSAIRTAMQ